MDDPLIYDVIDDILEIVFHLYGLLKPTKKHLIGMVDKNRFSRWLIERYERRYFDDIPTVCQISLFGLAYTEAFTVPLDIQMVFDDMDRYVMNRYDYYKNIATIIYNNDKFDYGLSIYIVPFDAVTYSVYELCSMIEALSSL